MNGSRIGTAICVAGLFCWIFALLRHLTRLDVPWAIVDSIAIVICLWLISVFQRIGDLRK